MRASPLRSEDRTSFSVRAAGGVHREIIAGGCHVWSFRPHFHMGEETVHLLAGKARLRLGAANRVVHAGEIVVVPAGAVHRFEPVDGTGWAFASEFKPISSPGECDSPLSARVKVLLVRRASLQTNISDLAKACEMSQGYLSRRFRLDVGTSLHSFHVLVALQQAKDCLKRGVSIVDAALDAGFYDQAHLTREFVRTFGMTPGSFRAAWLAAPELGAASN